MRKSYEEKRRRRKARGQKRPWRLKRMAMEAEDDAPSAPSGRGGREQRAGGGGTRHEQDMERFMQACFSALCTMSCALRACTLQCVLLLLSCSALSRTAAPSMTGLSHKLD